MGAIGLDWGTMALIACRGCQAASQKTWHIIDAKTNLISLDAYRADVNVANNVIPFSGAAMALAPAM
jgi:hypothetical protein